MLGFGAAVCALTTTSVNSAIGRQHASKHEVG